MADNHVLVRADVLEALSYYNKLDYVAVGGLLRERLAISWQPANGWKSLEQILNNLIDEGFVEQIKVLPNGETEPVLIRSYRLTLSGYIQKISQHGHTENILQ